MIDNAAIFLFGTLIVYTVFRAINLDKLIPWFSFQEVKEIKPQKKKFYK